MERISREVPGLLINAWYLDDGTLCGSADDLLSGLAIVEEDGPPRGLRLNRKKSLLHFPGFSSAVVNPLPSDIPVASSGFDLLGSPIGPSAFCERTILKRVMKLKDVLDRLSDLEDAQMETAILRSCLALRFLFALALLSFWETLLKSLTTSCLGQCQILLGDPCLVGLGSRLPFQQLWEAWGFGVLHFMLLLASLAHSTSRGNWCVPFWVMSPLLLLMWPLCLSAWLRPPGGRTGL